MARLLINGGNRSAVASAVASAEAEIEEQQTVMSTSESDYFYLPLRDAKKSLNMRINLMAKVSKIGTVLKSRGSDYVLMLKLLDQYESPPGLSVNLFGDNLDKLPQVRSTGDIISLHHVEMKVNKGEFFCTFNGKLSSFALFNGEAVMDLSPYQTSINYQAADNDKKLLMQLRTTSENRQPDQVLVEPIAILFCNLKAEEKLTVVCKVLHVSETSNGDLVLFVWDATDSPHVTLQIECDLGEDNWHCHGNIGLYLLDGDENPTLQINMPETDLAYSSYSTLMESLTYPEIIHKFKTVVRVVSSYPWQAKDLCTSATGNYRVRLTIEDSTARIHAYIFGEDGEKFFNGYPPIDLLAKKMNKLLGIRGSPVLRNPPWVWCCLKSYYLDENDPWGSRRYRIFGTTLLG